MTASIRRLSLGPKHACNFCTASLGTATVFRLPVVSSKSSSFAGAGFDPFRFLYPQHAATTTGGARNYKKESVDRVHLLDKLRKYVLTSDQPFHLHEYETLWASCRPRLSSIAAMHELVSVLIEVSCSILYSDLKPTVLDVMHKHPVLRGKDNAEDKSQHIADKLMVCRSTCDKLPLISKALSSLAYPSIRKLPCRSCLRR